jgi:hypothetical protein
LAEIVNEDAPLVLVGDSSASRFPGFSYAAYTKSGRRFYCVDLGGLSESRGPVKGGRVYAPGESLPDDRGDLAVIWVKPGRSVEAVELAHTAGCKRVWFSFHTAHADAVKRASELDMEVVEVGRCPVYYLEGAPTVCRAHAWVTKVSGTHARAPQTELDRSQRVMS